MAAFADRTIGNNRTHRMHGVVPWCRSAIDRNLVGRPTITGVLAHYNIECDVGTDSELIRPHGWRREDATCFFGVGKKNFSIHFRVPCNTFQSTLTAIALALSDVAYHATRLTIHMIN